MLLLNVVAYVLMHSLQLLRQLQGCRGHHRSKPLTKPLDKSWPFLRVATFVALEVHRVINCVGSTSSSLSRHQRSNRVHTSNEKLISSPQLQVHGEASAACRAYTCLSFLVELLLHKQTLLLGVFSGFTLSCEVSLGQPNVCLWKACDLNCFHELLLPEPCPFKPFL